MQKNRKTQAFTLIELLVVIAIIGLLAAILFPVFARVRESARRASCLSNMKQLGLAVEQYKQDFDGVYPFSRGFGKTWIGIVQPYLKSTQVGVCPSAPKNWPLSYTYNIMFGYQPYTETGYSPTASEDCNGKPQFVHRGVRDSAVTEPSTTILSTEASINYWYYRSTGKTDAQIVAVSNYFNPWFSSYRNYAGMENAGIHLGGVNCIYADGHAKWRRIGLMNDLAQWCATK
jgi:prepilin-type N-terminal cleavage/methylation domain-containing protein/prepilin-type processing-associated H-X9-DG protein